jgi:signal transduction histidine kinase
MIQNYGKIIAIILVISAGVNLYWFSVIIPEQFSLPTNYSRSTEFFGKDKIVGEFGGSFNEETKHQRNSLERVVKLDGDILKIEAEIVSKHVISDKVVFNAFDSYDVDRITKKHVDSDLYYAFPSNVEKTSYDFLHPVIHRPTTMQYVSTQIIDDLEVYFFQCAPSINDNSAAFPQFEGKTIKVEYSCNLWIEPITGKLIKMEIGWDNYFVEDGKKVHPTQIGGSGASDLFVFDAVKLAKYQLEILNIYERILPMVFWIITGLMILIVIFTQRLNVATSKGIQSQLEIQKQTNEFTNMISHELKTPLTPIRGYCEMLRDPKLLGPLSEKQDKAVQNIEKESSNLLSLIEKILLVRKMENELFEIIPSEIYLDDMVTEFIQKLSKEISDKGIELKIDVKDHEKITVDSRLMSQVFSNIILNAIDFVPKKNGKIQVSAKLDADNVTFRISNNGPAIPQNESDNLFKKFYQLDTSLTRPHEGSGLGLAVCKGIIESHGGKIWIESNSEMTSFIFRIPRRK